MYYTVAYRRLIYFRKYISWMPSLVSVDWSRVAVRLRDSDTSHCHIVLLHWLQFLPLYSPIHSSQNASLYMEASPKFALYLYQILDGFMGSYRPIKQWKVYIMWQHREDIPIWGVKVRKSNSHCSMLSVLLGDNKRIKVFDNLSKCSGMCQKCVKVL